MRADSLVVEISDFSMPTDIFFNILRLIPVEKCSLEVLGTSACCPLPPETASVFITTVTMQSEKVGDGCVAAESSLASLDLTNGFYSHFY